MATLKNAFANRVHAMPEAQGAEVVSHRLEYSLGAALALNDIIHLGFLPANHVPVDVMVDSDDLDTNGAPAIIYQAGVLNADEDDIDTTASGGASWIGSSDIGQAGGMARATGIAISRVPRSEHADLPIGIKVSTAPATGATSGKVGMTISYRAAYQEG